MREKKNCLLNYDAHMYMMVDRGDHAARTLVVSNQGKFNPDGHWMTPHAMHRWINIYSTRGNKVRANAWVDFVIGQHKLHHAISLQLE